MRLADLPARAIADCTAADVATAMNVCFQGYVVPVHVEAAAFDQRLRGEGLDAYVSRLYGPPGALAALLLVARRGWSSRIAAMGVAPDHRGKGLGRAIMEKALDDARARGDRTVWLEVFEQNVKALALYESLGFRRLRRLYGYGWMPPAELAARAGDDRLVEIDPLAFARHVGREGADDLPWMFQPETLAAATPPSRAFTLAAGPACATGYAHALVRDAPGDRVGLVALLVDRAHRRQGLARRLMLALAARFPGKTWVIPQIVPEDMAEPVLPALGWERLALNQFEMRVEP